MKTDPLAVTVAVPATTANLGPGFDAFGLAIGPRDPREGELSLRVSATSRAAGQVRVTTLGEGDGEVAEDDDNLVWRALLAFCAAYDVAVPDASLRAVNQLPLERGLGSSSAAIVAGLLLGRALTDVVVGDLALVRLASDLEGHPDNVAPALLGGLVACATDDHGELIVRRRNPGPALRPVALVPTVRQLTSSARAVLPEHLDRAQVADQAARAGHVLAGLTGAWPVASGLAGDRLHEPARFRAMPGSGAVIAELRGADVHCWLSGAGPTVIAVPGAADEQVRTAARRHGFEVHDLAVDLSGGVACPESGCAIAGSGGCVRCPRARV